ncbi:hypothetical protein ACLKA7_001704 [Drosophila subpalustris]
MDETWIHHYIPESNRSSAEWREAGESRSKRKKARRWADLAPSDYYLFSNLKIWLQGKKFYSNEEVEWETEAYFEGLSSHHYKKGIEMLKDRWTRCIKLDGDYIE